MNFFYHHQHILEFKRYNIYVKILLLYLLFVPYFDQGMYYKFY